MASSVAARKRRKLKMRLLTENSDDQMVVKSLSVPPGLEALMEGLTREVLRMQPQDICLFASEHFAKLIKMREASADEYQFCKTTIHDKIKHKNVPSRVTTQQPSPKDDVETLDGSSAMSVPRLDFGRLTNGVSPEIKRNTSEASTAEIDKIQAGFFNSKPEVTKSQEHANTEDEIKEEDNGTITREESKAEAGDMKNMEPAEHDDSESSKTKKDDDVIGEELAKSKENVESNTAEEDNAMKENQIQEEVNDKEVYENIEKDAVTKEIPNEEGNDEQKEETSNEVIAAHDESEESEPINVAEPVNKENEEEQSDVQEEKIEHSATTDKEAELNKTEKKEASNIVEDTKLSDEADSKLEATEERDDLSDSNDVVTQETEQEMKTMSPADKVLTSPIEENTVEESSVEDKPVPSNDTEVKPSEDSTEAKLVDESHEGQVVDISTENESHTGLEKAVINDEVAEKDSNKTPVHNSIIEGVQTDGEHNIRKRSVSKTDENEVQSLAIPEISTTVATPTPSEDGSSSADNVPKERDEHVNLPGEEKQIMAATKLQSFWRGYSLRKMRKSATLGNEEKSEDLDKLTTAATVIQAMWRGYRFRTSKAAETGAKHTTSPKTSPVKEARDVSDEQNIAATKIQSALRGYNVRKKRHIDMNDKTVREGKPSEKVVGNDAHEIAKEVMAATVIQALWRGYVMRKSRNLEATTQNTDVDIGKLNLAAAKIQSLWRGHSLRKLQNSGVVVGEHEMPGKEMESISEKEDATTGNSEQDAESKTDTKIIESDKHESEAEKVTELTEPVVETEMESEHIVQPSDWKENDKQDATELGMDKINDTVEPEIEAEKANDGESGNIAETTDSKGNMEGATAVPKSDLEYVKTTEEVDSVSKTDADVTELQHESPDSEKASDGNTETIINSDGLKSEAESEGIIEKSEPVVKPKEIVKTDNEVKSEEVAEKVEPIITVDETGGKVKSEEDAEKVEPSVKIDETGGEVKSEEVTEKVEPAVKADEAESQVISEEVAEKNEPIIKADETGGEVKSEEVAEKVEPVVIADETEGEVKSEKVAENVEPAVKANETECEVKSEEVAEKVEPAVRADETGGEVESEEVAEKVESAVKTDEIESEIKAEDDAEKMKEVAETSEPVIKADETDGEVKSEEVVEPVGKEEVNVETTEPEIKSDEFTETSESVVKPEEIVEATKTEGEAMSENIAELAEPAESKDISESTENDVKPDEISEPEVKAEEITDKVEPSVVNETTETGESSVSDKDASVTNNSSTTAEEVIGSMVVKPEEIANVAVPVLKTDEISETTTSEVKSTEPEKIVESETDAERNEDLHEGESAPILEHITQELAKKVESGPIETENENDTVPKTELHSDKENNSADGEAKETDETHAIDNNVNELDEAETISDSEKVSETTDNDKEKSAIIPGPDTENVEAKNTDITEKTEAGDSVEISMESPENTTITTPSEDMQSEVEHASEITKNSDNLSNEIAGSDAAVIENKEPESTVTKDEGLKEQSTTISTDSPEEKSTKLDEITSVKPTDVIVEANSEQDKLANRPDNDETNKDVTVNTDTTETQRTQNTESEDNEQIDTKENFNKSLNPHPLNETQADVNKHDEITEPEIKKESVKADEASPVDASPSNEEEHETGITYNIASDEEKMNETDEKSTINSISDIPSEAAESSEVTNENKSDLSEPEKKSADDGQSLVKTENIDHVDAPTEVPCSQMSNDGASAIETKEKTDEKAGLEDPVKANDAATKIQSTWRGYSVRKSNSIIADAAKSENNNETEDNVEQSSEDTGSKTETNEDEINKPTEANAEKAVEKLEIAEENASANTDETVDKVENVPDGAAKEDVAKEISEPVAEKIEHSTVNSENVNEAGTNDVSENNKETGGDLSSADENTLEDIGTSHEAVPATKTAEVETGEHVSETIGNKEDTSTVPVDEIVQQEVAGKVETPPNSIDNKSENVESGDKLEDDLEKHVEHDATLKEENVTSEGTDSRAEDHKDTYQASEASTVDIRDVEDSLKSPVQAEDGNDLEINVHEDAEKLNESSDTKNSLDADNKVKFYVGPDESNRIQIVDDDTDNHVTESDKPAADEGTNEIHKSVTSVLLTALSDDSEELEKDGATKEPNEADEHQNDDTNNASTINSSTENAEENSNKNTEGSKENSSENAGENISEPRDKQDQNAIDNNTEYNTLKSANHDSNIENDKSDAQHLAINVQSFDKALSEDENKEKESNSVEVDADNVESVAPKDDTGDTTSVTDARNVSEKLEKTTNAVEETNIAIETVNDEPLTEEQHAVNSENKSDSVQNKDSDPSPRNLPEEKSPEAATKVSNDAETTQDTAEGTVTAVEQHETIEADEATTHTLLDTTAKDIAHESTSGIIAEDEGNNELESEETHKVSDTPSITAAEHTEILPALENESPVNDEHKRTIDNDPKNEEDGLVHASVDAVVEDMPHESESQASASVNTTGENKNVELHETHSPVVTTTEDNQNEQMEHLEEKCTDKNIEENETEKFDETSVVPSTEDIKDEGDEKSEHLEENINDIKKNGEDSEHVTADSNKSAVEPVSHGISTDDKENGQSDTTEDKDAEKTIDKDKEAKKNINEESTVDNNENALISNEDIHSEVNGIKEANNVEDKPEDEIKIKDIESQIEHNETDDHMETKHNDEGIESEGNNAAPEENSPSDNEKSAGVTEDDNNTEQDKAAVKIQSAWKGYHVRQGLNEDKELAALQRPAECDELPAKTDAAEDTSILSQAATTIQAGARGYLVRKRRHLAKVTDVPLETADSTTVDESDSASQETVIENQVDTSQSVGSTELAKSEEENARDGTPKEETQANQDENQSTITPEGSRDVESNTVDAETSIAGGKERGNDNTMKETESKDVDNEKANIAESIAEINESLEEHTNKEEETANKNDQQKVDEIDALNLRLSNLNRSNVYQTVEEKEADDKVEEDHKTNDPNVVKMNFDRALSDLHTQTSKSSDDDGSVMTAPSNTDDSHNDDGRKPADDKELEGEDERSHEEPKNKEVGQVVTEPKANTTPRLSVNLNDFDSSKYDLKVEHASPRSKNTSPVHELTSAAYKIGAAIAVDNEAIVDAMDENAKDRSVVKPLEYIHIPLQGPLPEKTLEASREHVAADKNKDDGESPEYIYIPLKPPGTVDEEDEKENMADVDNQKEMKNETDTIPQSPTENKEGNEDSLKKKLSVSEPIEEKEDSADTREDKAKEDHDSNRKEQKHVDAKEIQESLADHAREKECDNETDQITKQQEPIPLMNKSSEPSSEAKSTEPNLLESKSPELSHGKSPEPIHSEKLTEKSPELSESQPATSVVSEEPTESLTAKENLEQSSVSEAKTPEAELLECNSKDSTVPERSTENLTTEDKSLVEHTSAEPEVLENNSAKTLSSEMKNVDPELSDNKSPEPVLSETKVSEKVNSEQVEKSKDNTSPTPSPGKSTSPIGDIDAFLQRNKSRTISRQANVDSSSRRTLFAEIDSLIDSYGQKRQMSPTSNDQPDIAAAQIEHESGAQGPQLSVRDDHLPDVIMANSDGVDRAATKIQSAYRGYRTRQQLKPAVQPRKDSEESDKTYTIDKHNGSTPDEEVLSDDDGTRNKAATKIQTTFREYQKKRSIEQNNSKEDKNVVDEELKARGEPKHANEDGNTKESVEHSNKLSEEPCPGETSAEADNNKELEESIEQSPDTTSVVDESVQQNASPSVAKVTDEEEKVTSENTPQSLEVHQSVVDYDSLNSEPERRHSPELGQVQHLKIAKLEDKYLDHVVTHDSGSDAKHEQLRDTSEITHEAAIKIQSTYRGFKTRQTLKNNNQQDRSSLETIPEVMSPTNLDKEHGAQGKNEEIMHEEHGSVVKSCEELDESPRQNSAPEQQYKSASQDTASTSDAWRYRLLQDTTTDAKDVSTSSTIRDEDDSEAYAHSSSPEGKLVQGYHHNQDAEEPAGLQHSGEMHDTLDIFLSSEELSQGAAMLTSRDTSAQDDVGGARAQCAPAAKHEAAGQHDDHSVMESAKIQSQKNNTPTTQHHQQQQQQQQVTDMGHDEAVAATKIQAGFRGYQVRKQMKLKKNGSDDAKVVKRCSSGRRRGSLRRGDNAKSGTDLEELSATKIQAGIRGFLVRKRQRSTKDKQ